MPRPAASLRPPALHALGLLGALVLATSCPPRPAPIPGAPERPDILLLLGDDHGARDVAALGHPVLRTPHLDRLAAEGRVFGGMHAVTAICQPSRAALFTGRVPHRSGVFGFYPLADGVPTLAGLLAESGYDTGLVGKSHLAPLEAYGFDFTATFTKEEDRAPERYARDVASFLGRRSTEIEENGAAAPFFLVVAFHDPHRPFAEPLEDELTRELPIPAQLVDLPEVRSDLGAYLATVERLDRAVGAVLAELERAGALGTTLVAYTADHGPAFPFAKTTLYELGLAVPFIVRWPGVTPPGTDLELRALTDVAPTLLALAGHELVDADGRSFAPALRGGESPGHAHLFASQTDHMRLPSTPMRSVRGPRYHYVVNFFPEREFVVDALATPTWQALAAADDERARERVERFLNRPSEELYDLESDPDELVDRADDPALADVKRTLRSALIAEMIRTADPFVHLLPDAPQGAREDARAAYADYERRQELRAERLLQR